MKWKIDFGDRPPHKWFAWFPVRLSHPDSDTKVWWEYVERTTTNCQGWICHHYSRLK